MLAKRIIPCLDVKEGKVVKGVHFENIKNVGDPVELARRYEEEGADELVFLDIAASYEQREVTVQMVEKIATVLTIPFTVGGGIGSTEQVANLLRAGADKVSINTQAVLKPELISELAEMFGSQCVVVAIDVKRTWDRINRRSYWEVFINGGRTPTGKDVLSWAQQVEKLGAGEILLTSMDADGTQAGYDISLIRKVAERVRLPIIASGGAGKLEHLLAVLREGKADAALVASIFHYRYFSIGEVKDFLQKRGIPMRWEN
ncbi:MAG TPA: imidazole glycerol phosphate synthase subunit HisF [Candidatus Atribacteria bacterium]|nr:imidazole glycerol phosphate synthase subunit HisF [Candidatus Atribacteria bacterium]HQE24722.1 imidazole glycerol phosphate synthase subunit HisF [Candidatus Atribacteria bacterium]